MELYKSVDEQLLIDFASLIPDTVYVFDLELMKIVFINSDKYLFSGYSIEEIKSMTSIIETTVHLNDQSLVKEHLRQVSQAEDDEVFSTEFRYKIKAGNYIWLKITSKIFKRNEEGKVTNIIAVARNISKEKEYEKYLETLTNTFRHAFKYSPMGMALVDLDGKFMDLNIAVSNITGYSKEELLQRKFHDITYSEDLAEDLMYVESLKRREIENFKMEKRYIKKNGDVVWVLISVTLVWDIDKPSFFIAQIADIDALKKLNIRLESQNSSLAATQDSLSNRLNQLEELNHIIAHNLRGPSQNLKMLSEMFFNREINDSEKTHEIPFSYPELSMLLFESSKSLCESLDSLIEVARVGLNRNISYDKCDMKKTFAKVNSHLNGMIQAKKAKITCDFKDKHIFCPEVYMQSIMYNLISNALKYSAKDIVPEIEISTWREGEKSFLSVKDNGLGIDLEKFGNKIFKLNQTFHKGYDSKGVGLFLTKAQIESIGGTIDVNSQIGIGSEFIVSFDN